MHYYYQAWALEPVSPNYWADVHRAYALQQDNPSQWKAHITRNSSSHSLQLKKPHAKQWRSSVPKKQKIKMKTKLLKKKYGVQGLPWRPTGWESTLPTWWAWVQSLRGELDTTCCKLKILQAARKMEASKCCSYEPAQPNMQTTQEAIVL